MKFCFFGNISSALNGKTEGGAELQISLLARALALNGHEVVIIDPDITKCFVSSDGIQLTGVPNWNKGIKGVRLFWYRIPELMRVLIDQKADYYYVRTRSYLHLLPYLASRKTKKKFIVATAHDLDVASFWDKFKYKYKTNFNLIKFFTVSLPNDLVFKYLMKKSDYIILQHEGQLRNLNSVKGKIIIFPNIFDFGIVRGIKDSPKDYYVHPGTLNILKGANNLSELINILDNNTSVVVIGQPTDKKSKRIYKHLNELENVVLTGRLNHKETIQLIANAKALINTSNFEGFPNIFLEAWAVGVPVISLNVNPGNVIKKHHLGTYCNGNLIEMKKTIESNSSDQYSKRKLISYVSEFHDFTTAAENILKNISSS